MTDMSAALDFRRITYRWAFLRGFAGEVIKSALDAVKGGRVDVAQYFANLLYFLPFSSTSVEKVLFYSLVKAGRGYVEKDPSLYEVKASEVPGFDPDEIYKVKTAFEFLSRLGMADLVAPDIIRLRLNTIKGIVEPIAPFLAAKDLNPQNFNPDAIAYPYTVISGISALSVMDKTDRLPNSFTVMAGLLSPTVHVERDGTIKRKTVIEKDEWILARSQMSKLKQFRDKFEVEYFKAVGLLHENRIIVKTYPIEVSGTLVDMVIAPAYDRYYRLRRERIISRMRK
jgi:hypothetical protein